MKKKLAVLAILSCICLTFAFAGCGSKDKKNAGKEPATTESSSLEGEKNSVSGITLNETTLSMTVGQTSTLTATLSPANATDKKVLWSTSNAEVVTVTEGIVVAKKAGVVAITVTSLDGNKTAACIITVTEDTSSVKSISLNTTGLSLVSGESGTIVATVLPSTALNKKVIWTTSNASVATVADGVVVGVSAGRAVITARTEDGEKTATCEVTVASTVWLTSAAYDGTGTTREREVPNATESVSFEAELVVSPKANYKIYTDATCQNELQNKTATLAEGNNVFYVKVTCGAESELYSMRIYRKHLYLVSFNTVDAGEIASQFVEEGDYAVVPAQNPTKTGYTFAGWSIDFDNKKITEHTIVTANWTANQYCVTFDSQGGDEVDSRLVTYNQTYYYLPQAYRTGYTFNGWFTEESEGVQVFEEDRVMLASAQTLYAHWTANRYTVTLVDDYSVIGEGQVTYDDTYGNFIYANTEITWEDINAYTKTGHTFEGWYTQDDLLVEENTVVKTANDHYLYASFSVDSYVVSFDTNGATDPADILVTYNTEYGTLPTPTWAGYQFEGWYTSTNYREEERVESYHTYTYDAGRTLHAKWKTDVVYERQGEAYYVKQANDGVENITVLGSYDGLPVVGILAGAFNDNWNLKEITLGENITEIPENCFNQCRNLSKIVATDKVKKIGDNAFRRCYALGTIIGITKIESIGSSAFNDCDNIASFTLPETVTAVGAGAFQDCNSLHTVVLGVGVTEIKKDTFKNCDKLSSVTFNGNVTEIGNNAFESCDSLEAITLPESLEAIGAASFQYTGLKSIVVPDSVAFIGDSAFRNCSDLRFAKLGELSIMGQYMFLSCSSLVEVVLPASSLINVKQQTFAVCNCLTKIYVYIDSSYNNEKFTIGSLNDPLKEANFYLYSESTPDFTAIPENCVGYWYYNEKDKPVIWTA